MFSARWTLLVAAIAFGTGCTSSSSDDSGSGGGRTGGGGASGTGGGTSASGGGNSATGGGESATGGGESATGGGDSATGGGESATGGGGAECATTLVEGQNTQLSPDLARPALNAMFEDPSYGLTVSRISEPAQITDAPVPSWVHHQTSVRSAFNADGTRAILTTDTGQFRLYSVSADGTFSFLKSLNMFENQEPTWHPSNPNLIYLLGPGGVSLQIRQYDIRNDSIAVFRDLSARTKALLGNSAATLNMPPTGRPSNDARTWCFQVRNTTDDPLGLIAFDAVSDTITGSLSLLDPVVSLSTSPNGTHCVVGHSGNGMRAYTTDFLTYTQLNPTPVLSDLARTANGRQVLVMRGETAVEMVDLELGVHTELFSVLGPNDAGTQLDLSGGAKAGYVVASFYNCQEASGTQPCDPAVQWFFEKVVAVELKASPRIFNLAHTHSAQRSAFASPNRDLTRVLFGSDWDAGGVGDSYLVQLPECALP